jgi:hypothetical protein
MSPYYLLTSLEMLSSLENLQLKHPRTREHLD